MRIDACFDSHVHWAAAGEFNQRLKLDALKSPRDILNIRPEKFHFRGEWLLGFGWDDNAWSEKPTREILDQWFPHTPVALSRCDAHAKWVNTEALKRAGLMLGELPKMNGGRIETNARGEPTGLLIDQAAELVEKLIPAVSAFEMRHHLLEGVRHFNEAGYTHIRDMTCNEAQWVEAMKLDRTGLLTLAVEEYFWVKGPEELDKVLNFVRMARTVQTGNLRAMGIKIFLDGALGSEGAWLSRCYCGRNHSGLQLWEVASLREALRKTWENDLHVAIHAIGDEAADLAIRTARELRDQDIQGVMHIEHGELIRPDTIAKMKGLDVEVHMQPAHWLSDRKWLENKIGDLVQHAFPWRKLQEAEVPFDFGSDAPIEPASIARIFQAMRESAAAGIPRLLGLPSSYISHRDLSWAPNSFTLLENEKPARIVFRGEHLN